MRRKNKIKILIIAIGFLFFLLPLNSFGLSKETVRAFNVYIRINQDASILVTESIFYNFDKSEHHGIYRIIPIKYKRGGGNYNLRIKVISVKDEDGKIYPYQVKKTGEDILIKTGQPETYISGLKLFKIKYRVERALNYFDDHDELYWNVTGNKWNVPIEQVSAQVGLPGYVEPTKLTHHCYTGYPNSIEQNCFSQVIAGGVVAYGLTKSLGPSQGLTIVFGFPKGAVMEPSDARKILWFLEDNWFVFLPLLTLFLLLGLWYTRGRDPRARSTIIPRYGPSDDLTSGEIGTIVDEEINPKDISATIISLAVRGYLKIREVEKKVLLFRTNDWKFIKLKELSGLTENYEKRIFNAIFSNKNEELLSNLKSKFSKELFKIRAALYSSLVRKRYFPVSPDKVRLIYFAIGLAIILLSIFLVSTIPNKYYALSVGVSGLLIMFFSRFMPRKTKKGALTHEHILGFKMYLEVAEKERIRFHNAPAKRPETFEKFLPYAIALGVERQWAKQFRDIYTSPPSWYEANYVGSFSVIYLTNNLSNFSTKFNQTIAGNRTGAGSGSSGNQSSSSSL